MDDKNINIIKNKLSDVESVVSMLNDGTAFESIIKLINMVDKKSLTDDNDPNTMLIRLLLETSSRQQLDEDIDTDIISELIDFIDDNEGDANIVTFNNLLRKFYGRKIRAIIYSEDALIKIDTSMKWIASGRFGRATAEIN